MIITRSPLRISLGGGGTDLPSYYRRYGGFVMAAAIDRYVYITVHRRFFDDIFLKYSKLELVKRIEEIQHPIIREALKLVGSNQHIEITSMADIPAGTGLGSSGSFTTALLKALYAYERRPVSIQQLAEQACDIEMNRLGEPVGKQDPYIAAFGGLTCFEFNPNDTVAVTPLRVSPETLLDLEDHLMLFFTGFCRSAGALLKEQDERSRQDDQAILEHLHRIKDIGLRSKERLEQGDIEGFGKLMHEHWKHKKQRTIRMTNQQIDAWYNLALENGAVGGKLIGAGGGGFLMFYASDKSRLRHALQAEGLQEVQFRFEFEGAKVIVA